MGTVLSFTSPLAPCEYLPEQRSQLRYEIIRHLTPDAYLSRMHAGWRRFGSVVFRPECPACRRCQSLRVPVCSFQPSLSQRRAWKANIDQLTVRVARPSRTPERILLFERFHRDGHARKGWPGEAGDFDLFLANPFATEEWSYWLRDRLLGIGYVDALADGLSAIYFYWEPAERRRSLGTFNILMLIDAARRRGLSYAYLGYYVAGCRSLEYKARFRPNETLAARGTWQPFVA
jgi:arginine-tRNA-protein transferase